MKTALLAPRAIVMLGNPVKMLLIIHLNLWRSFATSKRLDSRVEKVIPLTIRSNGELA